MTIETHHGIALDHDRMLSGDFRHDNDALQAKARDHLWMHFTRQSTMHEMGVPIIVRGEGHTIYDSDGRSYFDGLSGLFAVNAGHGRARLVEAAAKQMQELAFFPIWSYAHPTAIELADRLADYAPGDLNRVFFSTGGGDANETAWKVAKQYWKLQGKPMKTKVISRAVAYHGTPHGALSLTGLPAMKQMFEPLVPGAHHVPNTDFYRAPEHADDLLAFGQWAANQIEQAILMQGADTVAAVFLEPVQNSGGCLTPPPGYFQRVREICDKYDVLLVSDEVICAFGRLGNMFACTTYDYVPDMITCAKAITSGYAPMGATIISDRIYEPFSKGKVTFPHGYTFAGHPVAAALGLATLDLFEEEDLTGNVRRNSPLLRAELEKLVDVPIVGDVRGDGYFFALELVKDQKTKQTFDADERERLLRGFLPTAALEAGLYCRADDRGNSVLTIAPPLTVGQKEFVEIREILADVLTRAMNVI